MLARLRSSAAQVTGRVAQWVTGVAASMLRSGYEAYTGMPVGEAIAELLSQFVDLEINTSTIPIRASGKQVRLTSQFQELIKRELELEIDLDRSMINELELVVDLEMLFAGAAGDGHPCLNTDDDSNDYERTTDTLLVCDMARFVMHTPGIELIMRGLHIEVKKQSSAVATGSIGSVLRQLAFTSQQHLERVYTTQMCLPGFVSGIISDWILMGLRLDLSKILVALDFRQGALPGSKFDAEFVILVRHVELAHTNFVGRHLDKYSQLQAQDRAAALEYHLDHIPFSLEVEDLECRMGNVACVKLFGHKEHAKAVKAQVLQDHWVHYDIKAEVGALQLHIGRNCDSSDQHIPLLSVEPTELPWIQFRLCNMVDCIPGNNDTLLRSYQQGWENMVDKHPGQVELTQLRQEHQQLKDQLEELLSKGSASSQTAEDLRHEIEVLRFAQVRFYENKFWAYLEVDMQSCLRVHLDAAAISDTLLSIIECNISWIAHKIGAPQSRDGVLESAQWEQAIKAIAVAAVVDTNHDGEISDLEWQQVVGKGSTIESDMAHEANVLQQDLTILADALQAHCDLLQDTVQDVNMQASQKGKKMTQLESKLEKRTADVQVVQHGLKMLRKDATANKIENLAKWLEDLDFASSADLALQVLKVRRYLVATMPHEMRRKNTTVNNLVKWLEDLDFSSSALSLQVLKVGRYLVATTPQGSHKPIGIQLKLDLQLPVIQWQEEQEQGIEFKAHLGNLRARCPAQTTSAGSPVSVEDGVSSNFEVTLTSLSALVRDRSSDSLEHWEGFELLHMPAELRLYGTWTLYKGAIRLLPWTLSSLLVELWALNEQGNICSCTEPVGLGLSSEAREVLSRGCAIICEIASHPKRWERGVAGVSRSQLWRLGQAVVSRQVYKRWVLPAADDGNEAFSLTLRMHCRVAFLAMSQVSSDEPIDICSLIKQLMTLDPRDMNPKYRRNKLIEIWSPAVVCLLSVEDFEIRGPQHLNSFARCNSACMLLNPAHVRQFVDSWNLADLLKLQFDPLKDVPPDILEDAKGVLIGCVMPSPAFDVVPRTTKGDVIAAVTAKPIIHFGALDGVSVTIPSLRVLLLKEEALIVDLEVVKARLSGLIGGFICDQHLSSAVSTAHNLVQNVVDSGYVDQEDQEGIEEVKKAVDSGYVDQDRMEEVRKAVEFLGANQVFRGRILKTESQRQALQHLSLSVGALRIRGPVTKEERATWLWFFATDASVPLWQKHGTLVQPLQILYLLHELPKWYKRTNGDDLDSKTAKLIRDTEKKVTDAAVDYHSLGLAHCTVLMSLSTQCVAEAARILQLVRMLVPDLHHRWHFLQIALACTRVDIINLWPSLCLLNRTQMTSAVPSVPYEWPKWGWLKKMCFVLKGVLVFLFTME